MIDVLCDKYLSMMNPNIKAEGWMSSKDYNGCLWMLFVNCNKTIVRVISGKLSGGAGPGSVDGRALKDVPFTMVRPCRSCTGSCHSGLSFSAT